MYASFRQPSSPRSTPLYPPLLVDKGTGSQTLGNFLRYEEACASHREWKAVPFGSYLYQVPVNLRVTQTKQGCDMWQKVSETRLRQVSRNNCAVKNL